MTPALLWELENERMNEIALLTFPVDKLAWLYANSNRDPGEKDKDGRQVRPPAPVMDIEEFRTYSRKVKRTLAAKDGNQEWDGSLLGAKASKEAFQAWAGVKAGAIFIPKKES